MTNATLVILLVGFTVLGCRAGETTMESQGVLTASPSLPAGSSSPAGGVVSEEGGGGITGERATLASTTFDSWRFALALSESIRISGADRGTSVQEAIPAATTTHAPAVAKSGDAADVTVGGTQSTEGSNPSRRGTTTTRVEASSLAPYAVLRGWIAASRWPQTLWGMVEAIVLCESKGSTKAVSAGGHVGLMQIDPKLHGPQSSDPVVQLNAGYEVYQEQGFGAWSCA